MYDLEERLERLKMIRKSEGLNQQEFSERLHVSLSLLSKIEANISPMSDKFIHEVCKEFNVNEDWLRYGTGSMHIEKSKTAEINDFIDQITFSTADEDAMKKRLIYAMSKLKPKQWEALSSLIDVLIESKEEE